MPDTTKKLQSRKEVPQELTWDLSLIYATEEEMYQDAEKMEKMARDIADTYRGKLDTPEAIDACLTAYRKVWELMTSNPILALFVAAGLLPVGIGIFTALRNASRG